MDDKIPLKVAIESNPREYGIYNTYDWYRNQAKNYGHITIGNYEIPVTKERGVWVIKKTDLENGVQSFIKMEADTAERERLMNEDYRKGIFHPGIVCIGNYNYYHNRGDFRLEYNSRQRVLKESDERWYCNSCNELAETEHNNPECHICSDWDGCGEDCTLSKVFCSGCKKVLLI